MPKGSSMSRMDPSGTEWLPMVLWGWQNSQRGAGKWNNLAQSSGNMGPAAAFVKQFMDLVLLILWRMLTTAGAPFARLLATGMWVGLTMQALLHAIKRIVYSFIDWHLRPAKTRWLAFLLSWFPHLKRWHVTMGAPQPLPWSLQYFVLGLAAFRCLHARGGIHGVCVRFVWATW